ncbi:MAG: arginine--tRNA ligase [bacterium]
MHSIESYLSNLFSEAFASLGAQVGSVTPSDRPELADYQCNDALSCAKSLGMPPREVAQKVVDTLTGCSEFTLDIAGPGFINIRLDKQFLADQAKLATKDADYSSLTNVKDQKTVVDFGGMNVAKPLHIGHLRPSVIGESLRRLYVLLGANIQGDIHMGDWGTQMGMIISEIRRDQPELPYFDEQLTGPYPTESPVTLDDLEAIYPRSAARCKENEQAKKDALQATYELQQGRPGYRALWQHFVDISVSAIKVQMEKLDVHFDLWNGESHYHDLIGTMIADLKQRGLAVESEGALVVHLHPVDGKELPPLLLEKSDGAYLYSTSDLATILDRATDGVKRSLVVADQRQSLHFQQVFAAARQTGIAPEDMVLQHLGFGTMNGPDGRPFKTRAGGVMKLQDLIGEVQEKALQRLHEIGAAKDYSEEEQHEIAEKVGLAALKFGDLSTNSSSDYIFDIDKFVSFEGKTGPYLVYTTVRIKSIFRHVGEEVNSSEGLLAPATEAEHAVILSLTRFPQVLIDTQAGNAPHILCDHLFSLAQEFNRFYQNSHIANQPDPAIKRSWLTLAWLTQQQLELGLSLLGISVPERM